MNLTKEQKIASEYLWQSNQPQELQLIAGAGSGKTGTLIESVKICHENYTSAKNICLITFTVKAAKEMQERLQKFNIQVGFTGTMHSFAYHLLQQYYQKEINILEDVTKVQQQIIRENFQEVSHLPIEEISVKSLLNDKEFDIFSILYQKYKKQQNLLDFEDLILKATNLLKQEKIMNPFSVIFTDEFQDTSEIQLEFLKSLRYNKLFAVGDPRQSIYKFRGADVQISENFSKNFHNSKLLYLNTNFRSQKKIVNLGNKIIKLSNIKIKKKLKSFQSSSNPPITLINKIFISPLNTFKIFFSWYQKNHPKQSLTILVRTNYYVNLINKLISSFYSEIQVMTIHSSKGLEFENVAIFGIAKNTIPHHRNDYNEEIRLLYVALTRAKKNLIFIAWEEKNQEYSLFLPFLVKNTKLKYI